MAPPNAASARPGMLIAAASLLRRNHKPSQTEVEDAIGGVLCRCTGYRKIVDAILDVGDGRGAAGAGRGRGGGCAHRQARRHRQADRRRALRRRCLSGGLPLAPRHPLAPCQRAVHPRLAGALAPAAFRPGSGAERRRCAEQRLRRLSRYQGPAGAGGRRPGALSRRGGAGPGGGPRHGRGHRRGRAAPSTGRSRRRSSSPRRR